INENLCKDVKFNTLQRFYHSKCPLDQKLLSLKKDYIKKVLKNNSLGLIVHPQGFEPWTH
ncbi:hypothetical protein, partial [uncultured Bacteroides sp.]|uniref:hypothetical protein n=1 Tax=uncultured Bacteroides sp. TaxID=162156 RepID=UPI002635718C